MATKLDTKFQEIIHSVEHGIISRIIRRLSVFVILTGIAAIFLVVKFPGLTDAKGMDQAQVARNIASGEGYTTKVIRPLALWQIEKNEKTAATNRFPETYHAPLYPYLNSIPLMMAKSKLGTPLDSRIYTGDYIIAGTALVLYILGIFVWFKVGCLLFDRKVALIGCAMLTFCDLGWQFALTGLPQTCLFLLFACASYCLIQAVYNALESGGYLRWLLYAGICLGLMAITHPLTLFLTAGFLIFILLFFRKKWTPLVLILIPVLVLLAPWLMRNYQATGSPFGLAGYAALDGLQGSETYWMRQSNPNLDVVTFPGVRKKFFTNVIEQVNHITENLGWNLLAPLFFVALLYPFLTGVRTTFRWLLLFGWLGGLIGMAIFGTGGKLGANQLHFLFIPLFGFYGLAMALAMWNRLSIMHRSVKHLFVAGVVLVSSIPFILRILPGGESRFFVWPPYHPPSISVLSTFTQPDEIISADIPWATAWYANRMSLLLPESPERFSNFADFSNLGHPLVGLYLSPFSRDARFLSDLTKGEYKEWTTFITLSPDLQNFPLKTGIPLPIDQESIYYSDRPRWQTSAQ